MWRITPPDHLSCGQISPHDQIFSTGTARGARDKYEVCVDVVATVPPPPPPLETKKHASQKAREPKKEPGSLWLSLTLSGSIWLSLALSGSIWLSLALSGSL